MLTWRKGKAQSDSLVYMVITDFNIRIGKLKK